MMSQPLIGFSPHLHPVFLSPVASLPSRIGGSIAALQEPTFAQGTAPREGIAPSMPQPSSTNPRSLEKSLFLHVLVPLVVHPGLANVSSGRETCSFKLQAKFLTLESSLTSSGATTSPIKSRTLAAARRAFSQHRSMRRSPVCA